MLHHCRLPGFRDRGSGSGRDRQHSSSSCHLVILSPCAWLGKGCTVGAQEHERRARAEAPSTIRCGVITISDTRTPETDTSGAAIRSALEGAGHTIVRYAVAHDEPAEIVALVRE